ncbi:[protein-PII] uridylyltransferase [Amorphus orientalis]|uniref:Bifunctional uridylyltransferase/uridylyl-removing enzyme n=1 Tax=Amorphus orientalis TaxID=649198 RepID=A0AAE3VL63_9HYPH|nr:[protein-PII] uridylyltransferase [Amorphus orientalis]MDQ0313716.1 [protein-PII] uridylyltransferase [Amorphus orientalis]
MVTLADTPTTKRIRQGPQAVLDREALTERLVERIREDKGKWETARSDVLAIVREERDAAMSRIEALLAEDGGGLLCAQRIAKLHDDLIAAVSQVIVSYAYPADNPSSAERIAIVAVGGYGRGTLAPGSDIDLLFLFPYKQTGWVESVIEAVLYLLWDLGLTVGHATRSVEDCIRMARSDMTVRTAVLESRFLWGDEELAEELVQKFDSSVVRGSAAEFISAKLAERDERHRRQGRSRYLVEPNVKEGKGGLRDLNTLFWIAKYFFRVRTGEELVSLGVLTRADYRLFRKCEDFLWAVRCHLHFLTGRHEERLSFDLQREIAVRLGYTSHPGLRDVERFMKHYFLVAKDVGDLTRIFCSALEEDQVKQAPRLNRFLRTMRHGKSRAIRGTKDFVIDHNRINVADPEVFSRDPVNLIRVFYLADKHDLAFHPDAMTLIRRSLKLINAALREDEEANRLFLELLSSKNDPETILRRMNEAGVLGRFVTEFGRIVAMMQFNMYHHYTVDEHLIRTIGILADIEAGRLEADHPLATSLIPTIQNRRLLYVAVFLHDIAKGRPEDHSILGAKIARKLCPRFGLSPSETETVAWLIEVHLFMSSTAQSRDLGDPKTISDFAEIVQSPERLKLLAILTEADIAAVGPGVWNGWKAQLLRVLYDETEPRLAGGHSRMSREQRVAAAQSALRAALPDWPDDAMDAYVVRHYAPYWLRVDLADKIAHAGLIKDADDNDRRFASDVVTDGDSGVTRLTVFAPDHPRLLSAIFGSCSVAGANIVDAQIFTTSDGFALDTIAVTRQFADDEDEKRRADRILAMIDRSLGGQEKLPDKVEQRIRKKGGPKPFRIETEVLLHNGWSDNHTVLEVSGLDRPGLLYDLTREISDLNLNITSAHVATFGERVVDVFYVTDLVGHKISNGQRQNRIKRRLVSVFNGDARRGQAAA